jgi:hypothetical protein
MYGGKTICISDGDMKTQALVTFEKALYGFMASYVLFTVEELGVFDQLINGKRYSAKELAEFSGCDPRAMERLLLGATAVGLLDRDDGGYNLPEDLRPLFNPRNPAYVGGCFGHYRDITTKLFPFLPEAIRENKPQWSRFLPEEDGNDLFARIYSDPNDTAVFLESMWGLGYTPARQILAKFTLSDFNLLVDVGGASGSFAIAAVEANPSLRATVFDLEVVEPAFNTKISLHQVADRMSFVPGDMFRDAIPSADVYSLGYILSDWSYEQGTMLLEKIYKALPGGGAVLILEKLFDEDKRGPLSTAMMNLVMLLETYGEHHSVREYFEWLQTIGFCNCEIVRSEGEKHMIVGYKQ